MGPWTPWAPPPRSSYEECTVKQLRRLLVFRRDGHSIPKEWYLKARLIERLRLLDDMVRFRFLDLPLELRNNVYRELLLRADKISSHVVDRGTHAILRTSKQVYEEAIHLVRVENKFCIKITEDDEWGYYPGAISRFEFSDQYWMGQKNLYELSGIGYGWWVKVSVILLKVTSVRLSIILQESLLGPGPGPMPWEKTLRYRNTNRLLYALCSCLGQSQNLRKLEVDVDASSWPLNEETHSILDEILWPLAKLAPGSSTTRINGIPDALAQSLLAHIYQGGYRTNHWYATRSLKDKTESLMACMRTDRFSESEGDGLALSNLQRALAADMFRRGYWDADADASLGERVKIHESNFGGLLGRLAAQQHKSDVLRDLLVSFGHVPVENQNGDVTDPGEKQ